MGGRSGRTGQQPDGSDQPLNAPDRSDGGYGRGSGFEEDVGRRAGGRERDEMEDDLLAMDDEEEDLH